MDALNWNTIVSGFEQAHLLQTWEWGQVKARYGWQPAHLTWDAEGQLLPIDSTPGSAQVAPAAAALVLRRTIPAGGFAARLNVLYAPKGPLLDWQNQPLRQRVLADLQQFALRQGAIFIKIDPDVQLGRGLPGTPDAEDNALGAAIRAELQARRWLFSHEQIQFRNTVMIDLSPTIDELLAGMKQKTRYNIRLAERKGVSVRPGTTQDHGLLYNMYAETSLRDGFTIRDEAYYRAIWERFSQPAASSGPAWPQVEPLIAEVEGQPVAAVVIFRFAGKAWYLYGMSRQAHREKMPNYLLQWEAMQRAKASGCTTYDLWGAPDEFEEADPLWGVYRFKEGLGGSVVRHIGAWDMPVQPWLYKLYAQTLPKVLDVMRKRGKKRVEQAVV